MINFQIKQNGFNARVKKGEFYAETPEGKLIATISPRLMLNGKCSDRFVNVCFMDGTIEIADELEDGEHAASELIAKRLYA
jgi:hypothetical protein